MPIAALKLRPGVQAEFTETLNEGGVSASNLIRYKAGLPEKLGGWDRFYPFNVTGTPRALHAWQVLSGTDHLAIGTTEQLGDIADGVLIDITPETITSDFAPDFSVTNGSAIITVVDPNVSDLTTFDSVMFMTPVTVGGILLRGVYPIATITGVNSYTIVAQALATATVANGGDVPSFDSTLGSPVVLVTLSDHGRAVGDDFTFLLPTAVGGITIEGTYRILDVPTVNDFEISGNVEASATANTQMNNAEAQLLYFINHGPPPPGSGFGLLGFGDGGFGTGATSTAAAGTPITTENWTLANWGEILLACPRGSGIFSWGPNTGFANAGLVATAPVFNTGIFIAMPAQILVAYGSTAAAPTSHVTPRSPDQQDPLMVRWSAVEDFTDFAPAATDQAGSFRIPSGSMIVGGMQGPQQALLWTDIDVWAMQYLGAPLVFGFDKIAEGCGLIAQHAARVLRGVVYWMSQGNFFRLTGAGVQVIPCTVWDVVFQDLDTANQHKCIAAPNSGHTEIAWHYPSVSIGSGEPDRYVKYNVEENTWDFGVLPFGRSAWIDQSVLGEPIGATPSGLIYQHEVSPNADGQPMNWWFETGWFVITEGRDLAFVDWFFPDMKWGLFEGAQSASVAITIYATDYPNGTVRTFGPYTVTAAKAYVNTRLRGRMVRLRFEGNDLNSFARLGLMRFRIAADGRR